MKIDSLTVFPYARWGFKRYNQFEWKDEWSTFIRIANREKKTIEFHKYFKTKTVAYLIYFFDSQILQRIDVDNKITLDVRIRILCGMVNKMPIESLTRDLKIAFMECIWDTYKKFRQSYEDWYCLNILGLPFLSIESLLTLLAH